MSHHYTQMSRETKRIVGPLFGHDEKSPAGDIYAALYDAANGVGMDDAPALARIIDAMTPLAERVAFLDSRVHRYTERVRGRVEQIVYESRHPGVTLVNDPAATYRILAEDAGEAARDVRERAELHKQLASQAELVKALWFDLTGAPFAGLGDYARAS